MGAYSIQEREGNNCPILRRPVPARREILFADHKRLGYRAPDSNKNRVWRVEDSGSIGAKLRSFGLKGPKAEPLTQYAGKRSGLSEAERLKPKVKVIFEAFLSSQFILTCRAGKIGIYQGPSGTEIRVQFESETIWLTQRQMAQLFDKAVRTVNEHIQNIFLAPVNWSGTQPSGISG